MILISILFVFKGFEIVRLISRRVALPPEQGKVRDDRRDQRDGLHHGSPRGERDQHRQESLPGNKNLCKWLISCLA